MTFSQLLLILRARKWLIISTLVIVVAIVLAITLALPKTYRASATLVLNFKGTDPVSGLVLPAQLSSGYLATQVDIATSKNVALKVVDNLKLADFPNIRQQFAQATNNTGSIRDWLANLLLKTVDVTPSRESSVLEINVKGADPQFAATVANAFATAYQQTNLQLKVGPMQKASTYFTDQIKALRANLEAAQNKLSNYQQEKGLVSTDNRLDVESARLNELSTQLVLAQGQLMEADSRERQAQRGTGDAPEIVSNNLIQGLKSSLAQAESKFAQLSQNLDKNHPQYQAAEAEVEKLRSELNRNINTTSSSISSNARSSRQREAEIRAALAQQKEKVLQLNRVRDELSLLVKEVESAQRAYDTTSQRFTQTSLEGQSNQSDVAILNPAVAPLSPASPNLPLNLVLSVFFGTLLGIALATFVEITNRRVRSSSDLIDVLQIPVLGEIDWKQRNRKLRKPTRKTPLLPHRTGSTA